MAKQAELGDMAGTHRHATNKANDKGLNDGME